jgi:hypothetical protein
MNRIAVIKSLIAIANSLEDQELSSEASRLDAVIRKIASIDDEGGLQGDFNISPSIINSLGGDSAMNEQNSSAMQQAERMINEAAGVPSLRELAVRWSVSPGSALWIYAQTGEVNDLVHRKALLKEISEAIDKNHDPQEAILLNQFYSLILKTLPVAIGQNKVNVKSVNHSRKPSDIGGEDIFLTFTTEDDHVGGIQMHKSDKGQIQFVGSGYFKDGKFMSWGYNAQDSSLLANALNSFLMEQERQSYR